MIQRSRQENLKKNYKGLMKGTASQNGFPQSPAWAIIYLLTIGEDKLSSLSCHWQIMMFFSTSSNNFLMNRSSVNKKRLV